MAKKLTVVHSRADLRNVVFLRSSPFNGLSYGRVKIEDLSTDEQSRVVTTEACTGKYLREGKRCACLKPCIFAVIKLTPKEIKQRGSELEQLLRMSLKK